MSVRSQPSGRVLSSPALRLLGTDDRVDAVRLKEPLGVFIDYVPETDSTLVGLVFREGDVPLESGCGRCGVCIRTPVGRTGLVQCVRSLVGDLRACAAAMRFST